jgi:hypothetical protein
MVQDAVIVRFPGAPGVVAARYAEGLRRFREANPETRPETVFLGRSERTPNELVVVLLWPEGVAHGVLGEFLLRQLADLGLERPTSVDHLAISCVGFDRIASLPAEP